MANKANEKHDDKTNVSNAPHQSAKEAGKRAAQIMPEFADYFRVLVAIAMAALFLWCLFLIWPMLTGGSPPPRRL